MSGSTAFDCAFTGNLDFDCQLISGLTGADGCYDVKTRRLKIGVRSAWLCFISSMSGDLLAERLISDCLAAEVYENDDAHSFSGRCLSIGNIKITCSAKCAADDVFDGCAVIIIDGFKEAITADIKETPSRGIGEPESDRVLRGARDGFTEKLLDNTALLRLRIKSPDLRLNKLSVGRGSSTSVLVCHIEGRANRNFIKAITERIEAIDTDALSMGQESLAECLVRRKWYNPFPKFRYTERPDAACAMLLEGSVIILCDNSPQAMMLPCSLFDFIQETDDFYFPPITGTYLRLVRLCIFLLSFLLVPVWYLLIKNPDIIPACLSFIKLEDSGGLPLIFQILLVEFTIDGLKLASINTPGSLNNSLSVVAGLIIGDFAVTVGWLVPEVILYMSFVAMASFTQPSFELGYAFKFMRVLLTVLIALFNYIGLAAGLALTLVFICSNTTPTGGRCYLYPLVPFNKRALLRQLFRVRLKPDNMKK